MTLAPFPRRKGEYIPPAYGGCGCSCHRHPGVFHVMPCCYPGKDEPFQPMCPGVIPPNEENEDGEQK